MSRLGWGQRETTAAGTALLFPERCPFPWAQSCLQYRLSDRKVKTPVEPSWGELQGAWGGKEPSASGQGVAVEPFPNTPLERSEW